MAVSGVNSYLYNTSYGVNSNSNSVFDYDAAQRAANEQASTLLKSLEGNSNTTKQLTSGTSSYLDRYSASMKSLGQSADKLRNGGIDKLLYDKEGNITEDTIASTVKAVEDMVTAHNDSIKLLNDNADRGGGTAKQLARMVQDPAPEASMKLVGVTVNSDGTLALDTEAMTKALTDAAETAKNPETAGQLNLLKDIIGGNGGIADGIQKNAVTGSNISAQKLVDNDLAEIQSSSSTNQFSEMWQSMKGNVHYLNNLAATGMMMNILA